MKSILNFILILSIYLCSFNNIVETKSLGSITFFNTSYAGFSVSDCVGKIEDQAICDGIKQTYEQCLSLIHI